MLHCFVDALPLEDEPVYVSDKNQTVEDSHSKQGDEADGGRHT